MGETKANSLHDLILECYAFGIVVLEPAVLNHASVNPMVNNHD
jgi:hypothetical protein